MSSKRDRIAEILERKQRASYRVGQRLRALYEIESLANDFSMDPERERELIRYAIINAVTCIEVFARACVADLIDADPKCLERSEKLTKNFKFDFPTVRDLYGRRVTLGEFISHSISVNNLTDIASHLETLTTNKFKETLAQTFDRRAQKEERRPILTEPDRVFQSVEKLFTQRHILVHELPTSADLDWAIVSEWLSDSSDFVWAIDEMVSEHIDPNAPQTQMEMNEQASSALVDSDAKLKKSIHLLKKVAMPDSSTTIEEAMDAWTEVREKFSRIEARRYKGGSMAPMIYARAATRLTDDLNRYLTEAIEKLRDP